MSQELSSLCTIYCSGASVIVAHNALRNDEGHHDLFCNESALCLQSASSINWIINLLKTNQ